MKAPISFSRRMVPIESLRSMRRGILLDPHYQRQGDVWPSDKQQLFIDSLLNGFLVPPMYWHLLQGSSEYYDGDTQYAVVDGRQRLETIFGYLDGDFALSPDNELLFDPTVALGSVHLNDLRERHPWLYAQFMSTNLEVVVIETEDVDLIEEMFSRLNEGVPLKAAERRNRGKILQPRVKTLAENHTFFATRLPFGNKRFRYYDLLAKFMRLEDVGVPDGRVPNLRKVDLDRLFLRLRALEHTEQDMGKAIIDKLLGRVSFRLDQLSENFRPQDRYLGSVGMVTLYYVTDLWLAEHQEPPLERAEIEHFEGLRIAMKGRSEPTMTELEWLMTEFASYSQGPTSGSYLSARLRIILKVLRNLDAISLPDSEDF